MNINHPVVLFPQPTNMTCWSAAATMVLGGTMSVGPAGGTLGTDGGLAPSSVPAFGRSLGLLVEYPQSWSVDGLAGLIRNGPLWVGGAVPSLHAFVVGGINGDGTANGTILTIYDPWPPGVGAVLLVSYGQFMARFPMATMYILHR